MNAAPSTWLAALPRWRKGPRLGAAWVVAALVALGVVALRIVQSFLSVDHLPAGGHFGTAWAPYSDALDPWLAGALAYYLGLAPQLNLHRPTIGLFEGSILAATGRIEMIPILTATFVLALVAAVLLRGRDTALRGALVVTLGIIAACFERTWGLLHVSSTGVDLPSMAITLAGTLLLLAQRARAAGAALLVGCLCLGLAATIRGPMMLAGPVMIAIRMRLVERVPAVIIVISSLAFVLPIAIDAALRKSTGATANSLVALFCVYADRSHGWTGECDAAFFAQKPTGLQVFLDYFSYAASSEGRSYLLNSVASRLTLELRPLHSKASLSILAAAGLLAWAMRPTNSPGRQRIEISPLIAAAVVVASLYWLGRTEPNPALAWLIVATAAAAALCLWEAVLCLAGFILGTAFLSLVGAVDYRFQQSFGFLLFLGVGFLIMGRPRLAMESAPPAAIEWAVPAAVAAVILFLYLGSFVIPSEVRAVYRDQVHHRKDAAIKIADDARIDRSLYYLGARQLVYTRHDSLPIGAVRRFRGLATSDISNESFVNPNRFLE